MRTPIYKLCCFPIDSQNTNKFCFLCKNVVWTLPEALYQRLQKLATRGHYKYERFLSQEALLHVVRAPEETPKMFAKKISPTKLKKEGSGTYRGTYRTCVKNDTTRWCCNQDQHIWPVIFRLHKSFKDFSPSNSPLQSSNGTGRGDSCRSKTLRRVFGQA